MDPLIGAAAISAASSIVQAYNAEKTRGGNSKRLKELRKAFESIVPPEYDISIDDPPKYIEQALPKANLDFSRITPEAYKVIGKYSPESAEFVREAAPKLVTGSAQQKEGRQAQLDALRSMQKVARGESPEMRIKMQQAADASQAEAQSRTQSLLQDAQRRGMAGSGLSFAAALQGAGDSMRTGALASQNAALAAYKDKLAAIQSSGQMGRQLSEDELSVERGNNDTLNSFNERTSRAYQDYLNQRAAMKNEAQRYNLGREQEISNRNVSARNEAERDNLDRKNRLTQQEYDNSRTERNYQDKIAYDRAAWAAQQRDKQNSLKRQAYDDKLRRAGFMHGIASSENQNDMQNAQDRNAAIGGIANAAAGYFSGQSQREAQREAEARDEARWEKRYGKGKYSQLDDDSYDKYYSMA